MQFVKNKEDATNRKTLLTLQQKKKKLFKSQIILLNFLLQKFTIFRFEIFWYCHHATIKVAPFLQYIINT